MPYRCLGWLRVWRVSEQGGVLKAYFRGPCSSNTILSLSSQVEGGICELEWLRPHPVTLGYMEFYGFSTHHWDDPWTPGFRVKSLRGATLPEFASPQRHAESSSSFHEGPW